MTIVRTVLGHKPTVLVLDLNMPGDLSSLDAIPRVREVSPNSHIVVLTMQEEPEFADVRCAPERSAKSSRSPPTTSW